jgi:hypothetical protein
MTTLVSAPTAYVCANFICVRKTWDDIDQKLACRYHQSSRIEHTRMIGILALLHHGYSLGKCFPSRRSGGLRHPLYCSMRSRRAFTWLWFDSHCNSGGQDAQLAVSARQVRDVHQHVTWKMHVFTVKSRCRHVRL